MYREYKLLCEFRQKPILSEYIFREVFNTKFNLSFKRPRIDTNVKYVTKLTQS